MSDLLKKVVEGKMNGQYVWICDYRYGRFNFTSDYAKSKPIRHVRPQCVFIRSNSELKNKSIYYTESHFVVLNKKGEPINSKTISPFDNTGYRCEGEGVNVFLTEAECLACYVEQVDVAITGLSKYKRDVSAEVDARLRELEEIKIKHTRIELTPAMDSVLERTGGEWADVVEQFTRLSPFEIRENLGEMFSLDNSELAQDIWDELN